MLATQNLNEENSLPKSAEKVFNVEKDPIEKLSLTPGELKYFLLEVNKQFTENTGVIDLGKALRNARYLAEIARRIAEVEAGHWEEHDLIEVDDDDE